MKISTQIRIQAAAIALCALAGAARAQMTLPCSNQTLSGDYSFTVAGQILNSDGTTTTRNGVAMAHFDGVGGWSQTDYVMSLTPGQNPPGGIDTNPVFRTGETGVYQVNGDCTGFATINFPAPPGVTSGAVIKLAFVITDNGNAIHTVVTSLIPPGASAPIPVVIHSDGERVRPFLP